MKFKELFTDLKDYTAEYDPKDVESGKGMSILSYIGILFLIPYLAEKNNKFVRFHAIQGFILSFIYSAAYGIVCAILALIPIIGWILIGLLGLVPVGFFVLYVWGIVNVCNGKAKELPVVNKLKIIKQ